MSQVPQNTYLFHDSLRENVRLNNQSLDDETILEVLHGVCLCELISKMPNGLDTVLIEGGKGLSGGERQKIAIARAVIRDSPVAIFDEPLSHIDRSSQKKIMSFLAEVMKEKIVIVVSHNEIRQYVDRNFELTEGHLRPMG